MSDEADDSIPERMSKAERDALASRIAPSLRRGVSEKAGTYGFSKATHLRRVARVDKDGHVVGYTTLDEVQKSLLRRHELEIDVQPDERPKEIMCRSCGKPMPVSRDRGRLPRYCRRCVGESRCAKCNGLLKAGTVLAALEAGRSIDAIVCRTCFVDGKKAPKCFDCGVGLGPDAMCPYAVRKRNGDHARCNPCASKRRVKPKLACVDCGGEVAAGQECPSRVQKRGDRPVRCRKCAYAVRRELLVQQAKAMTAANRLRKTRQRGTKQ